MIQISMPKSVPIEFTLRIMTEASWFDWRHSKSCVHPLNGCCFHNEQLFNATIYCDHCNERFVVIVR